MTTEQRINELAKEMNVTPADVLCFAKSIVQGIATDGAADVFCYADEKTQKDMIEAYAVEAVKKFEKFQTRLHTNPEAKRLFAEKILSLM